MTDASHTSWFGAKLRVSESSMRLALLFVYHELECTWINGRIQTTLLSCPFVGLTVATVTVPP